MFQIIDDKQNPQSLRKEKIRCGELQTGVASLHLLQNPRAYIGEQHQQAFDSQHGFRSRRSCETQLVQFVHDVISNLDGVMNRGHKQTDLIIMDFAKTFDKVPHMRLLHKLEKQGIRGSIHKWISS